ncbi:hypothetical protein VTP01DRAFT_3257 [Rhizomucor pusillus]|uniref:uncharacterized protein n=1 Tax=Rhizomucor pusillus TaxID=4840 RepID=UPI003743F081
MLPHQMLDTLHMQVQQTFACAKTADNDNKLLESIDAVYDLLERLIQWSYDRYTNIELQDGHEEDKEEDTYRVRPQDVVRANQIARNLLVRTVAGKLGDVGEERMETAARLLAHLSGRGAAGPITRTWHFPYLDPNGVRCEHQIRIHEPSYIGNDIGFKTWGSAPLLTKKLIQQNLIPDITNRHILELATGTGLVGLACDKLGAAQVIMTDYHESVLKNAAINVQLNESRATVQKLDFIEVARDEDPVWKGRTFDVVVASDLLYEMEHAEYLPIAVNKLMENEFYFMIPLRPTHWAEVERFEQGMERLGLLTRRVTELEKLEEEGMVRYRLYEFTR